MRRVKKLVLIFGFLLAVSGGLLTAVVTKDMVSGSYALGVDFDYIVISPAAFALRAFPFLERHDWLWMPLAILLNTVLCFSVGALVGYVFSVLVRRHSKNEIAA